MGWIRSWNQLRQKRKLDIALSYIIMIEILKTLSLLQKTDIFLSEIIFHFFIKQKDMSSISMKLSDIIQTVCFKSYYYITDKIKHSLGHIFVCRSSFVGKKYIFVWFFSLVVGWNNLFTLWQVSRWPQIIYIELV